ncbi:MAG TPA: hypothetical protein VGB13_13140 [Candidatus Krumholzibacteria bacterium]
MRRSTQFFVLGAILAVGVANGACGGADDAKAPTPVPSAAHASPTPGPAATYPVEPTPTPVVWNTVVAPEAPNAGRTDCPADWVAYIDGEGRFSICYPGTFSAQASTLSLNASSAPATDEADTSLSIVVSWGQRPYFSLPPNEENCALVADSLLGPTGSRAITLELSGRKVIACLNEGCVNSIQGSTTLAEDGSDKYGYVRFTVNYSGPTAQASAEALAILNSLRIEFR